MTENTVEVFVKSSLQIGAHKKKAESLRDEKC